MERVATHDKGGVPEVPALDAPHAQYVGVVIAPLIWYGLIWYGLPNTPAMHDFRGQTHSACSSGGARDLAVLSTAHYPAG